MLNQYGDNITSKATDINVSASVGTTPAFNAKKETITTAGYDFTATNAVDSVVITVVDPDTGVTASKKLPVADAVQVSEFALTEVKLPEKATRILENKAEAATIGFTAKDQYGKDVKDPSSAIQLISSDSTAADFTWATDVDGNYYVKITTGSVVAAKDVILTAVNRVTGATTSKTIKVEKPSVATTITLGEFDKDTIAVGDKAYMSVEVKDQYGEVLAPKDYIGSVHTPSSSKGSASFVTNKYDKNYGKIELDLTAGGITEGTAVMTVSKGADVKTKTVKIEKQRVLSEIVAPKAQTLVQGASTNLGFKFFDQYGEEIKNANVANKANSSYRITLTRVSGDEGAVTVTAPGSLLGDAETNLKTITAQAVNGKTGTYTVLVELFDKDLVAGAVASNAKVVSEAKATVNVVANDAQGLTYTLEAIDPLVFDGTGATPDGTSAYEKAVKVVGTDANGNKVTINPSQITKVEIVSDTNSDFGISTGVVTDGGNTKIDILEGYYTVAAAQAFDKDNYSKNAKVRVTLNTADGIKVLETPLTLSQETPVVQEVVLVDKEVTADDPFKLATGTNVVDELTFANQSALESGTTVSGSLDNVYVYTVDQFGVYTLLTGDQDLTVNTTSLIDLKGEKLIVDNANGLLKLVDGNSSSSVSAIEFSAGKKIKVSAVAGGKTAALNVIINAETPPTVTSSLSGTTKVLTIASGANSSVTFSENLNSASQTSVINALKARQGGTGVATYTWTDAKTLKISAADANVTFDTTGNIKSDIADSYNNKTTDAVLVTE